MEYRDINDGLDMDTVTTVWRGVMEMVVYLKGQQRHGQQIGVKKLQWQCYGYGYFEVVMSVEEQYGEEIISGGSVMDKVSMAQLICIWQKRCGYSVGSIIMDIGAED